MNIKTISIVRWIARTTGAILLLIIAAFVIGEGFPNPAALPLNEFIIFVVLTFMEIGVVIAFKWELPGGVLIIAGYLVFALIEKKLIAGPLFPAFFIVGVLFLLCWWMDRKRIIKG